MKRSTSAVLTIASLAGMASIANAVPFGPNNLATQAGGLGLVKLRKRAAQAVAA